MCFVERWEFVKESGKKVIKVSFVKSKLRLGIKTIHDPMFLLQSQRRVFPGCQFPVKDRRGHGKTVVVRVESPTGEETRGSGGNKV